jgi:hypothetical protein
LSKQLNLSLSDGGWIFKFCQRVKVGEGSCHFSGAFSQTQNQLKTNDNKNTEKILVRRLAKFTFLKSVKPHHSFQPGVRSVDIHQNLIAWTFHGTITWDPSIKGQFRPWIGVVAGASWKFDNSFKSRFPIDRWLQGCSQDPLEAKIQLLFYSRLSLRTPSKSTSQYGLKERFLCLPFSHKFSIF